MGLQNFAIMGLKLKIVIDLFNAIPLGRNDHSRRPWLVTSSAWGESKSISQAF